MVALLTARSYLRLTLRFPSVAGTVELPSRAFGSGMVTGALSVLLCLSYVALLGVNAFAFGSYGVTLVGRGVLGPPVLASSALVILALLNCLGPQLEIRSESALNIVKVAILTV